MQQKHTTSPPCARADLKQQARRTAPDHADLCMWLAERVKVLEAALQAEVKRCCRCKGTGKTFDQRYDAASGEMEDGPVIPCPYCKAMRAALDPPKKGAENV